MQKQSRMAELSESIGFDIRVPTEKQILENPKREAFLGGGWVDTWELDVINVYWHRRQRLFTVYSLLSVLEHETLHGVLARFVELDASIKLDNVHRSSCAWLDDDRLIFVNEFRFAEGWRFPSYLEEPTDDLL